MRFQKGNKMGGRTTGSKNRVNQPIRDKFLELLETNMERMQKDLDELEPKERIKLLLDMASFCIPKLKAIEQNNFNHNETNEVELTEAEAKVVASALLENY